MGRHVAGAPGVWYHASPAAMVAGTVLHPDPDDRFPQAHPERVYFTPDPWVALLHHGGITAFLDGRTHLYVVEPMGPVEDDPEAVAVGKRGQSYMAPGARIIREITFDMPEAKKVLAMQREAAFNPDSLVRVVPQGSPSQVVPGLGRGAYQWTYTAPDGTVYYLQDTLNREIVAHTSSTFEAGTFTWGRDGVIFGVYVEHGHRRKGLASAMLEMARGLYPQDNIRHSNSLSDDGRAWSQAVASVTPIHAGSQEKVKRTATISGSGQVPVYNTPEGYVFRGMVVMDPPYDETAKRLMDHRVTARDLLGYLKGAVGRFWGESPEWEIASSMDHAEATLGWGNWLTLDERFGDFAGTGFCIVLVAKKPQGFDAKDWDWTYGERPQGVRLDLVEIWYSIDGTWRVVPASGMQVTSRRTASIDSVALQEAYRFFLGLGLREGDALCYAAEEEITRRSPQLSEAQVASLVGRVLADAGQVDAVEAISFAPARSTRGAQVAAGYYSAGRGKHGFVFADRSEVSVLHECAHALSGGRDTHQYRFYLKFEELLRTYAQGGGALADEFREARSALVAARTSSVRTAMPSWRDRGALPSADIVIHPDTGRGSGRNYFAVYFYGQMEGRFTRLQQAKDFVEQVFGPVQWRRVKGDQTPHFDPVWGETVEFNDAKAYWIVEQAPRLAPHVALAHTAASWGDEYGAEMAVRDVLPESHPLRRVLGSGEIKAMAETLLRGAGYDGPIRIDTDASMDERTKGRAMWGPFGGARLTFASGYVMAWTVVHECAHVLSLYRQHQQDGTTHQPPHGPAFQKALAELLASAGHTASAEVQVEDGGAIDGGHILYATDGGQRVGYLWWYTQDDAATGSKAGEVGAVSVDAAYRRRGVATALWERAKALDFRVHHSPAQSDEGAAWARVTAAVGQNDSNYIARGITIDITQRRLAEAAERGALTAQDIVNALHQQSGRVGSWWGILGEFESIDGMRSSWAWVEDEETLRTALEWKRDPQTSHYDLMGGVGVVLIAKRPVVNGKPWHPDDVTDDERGFMIHPLMGNSSLPTSIDSVDLVEVHYNAGWGWKVLPAQGMRVKAALDEQESDAYSKEHGQDRQRRGSRGGRGAGGRRPGAVGDAASDRGRRDSDSSAGHRLRVRSGTGAGVLRPAVAAGGDLDGFSASARRDLRHLDRQAVIQVLRGLADLARGGPRTQVAPLKGHPGVMRLRVGEYRVVFRERGSTIEVIAVAHRREVYQMLRRRLGAIDPVRQGLCYPLAYEHLMANDDGTNRLVHGTINGSTNHAWVEWTTAPQVVYDPVLDEEFERDYYYRHARAVAEQVYTPAGAERMLADTGHYGPWDGSVTAKTAGPLRLDLVFTHARNTVAAHLPDGPEVGVLSWYTEDGVSQEGIPHRAGEIQVVEVDERYRRQGVATALWDEARKVEPRLHHSLVRTDRGDAWARAVSPDAAPREWTYNPDAWTQRGRAPRQVTSAMALPEDIRFVQVTMPGGLNSVQAMVPRPGTDPQGWAEASDMEVLTGLGQGIGSLAWHTSAGHDEDGLPYGKGDISLVEVQPAYRRRGVATALLDAARRIDPSVKHSPVRSDSGDAWARAVGSPPPRTHDWVGPGQVPRRVTSAAQVRHQVGTPLDYRGKFYGRAQRLYVIEPGYSAVREMQAKRPDKDEATIRKWVTSGNWEGTPDDVVAYLDYFETADAIYIGFMTTRDDRKKRGLASALVADLYRRYGATHAMEWGEIMDTGAEVLFRRYLSQHERTWGKVWGSRTAAWTPYPDPPGMTIREGGDAVPGGYNGWYAVFDTATGERMGYLDYQSAGKWDVTIAMVEVEPQHRRKGVATLLVKRLRHDFPEAEIDPGYSTSDGSAFLPSVRHLLGARTGALAADERASLEGRSGLSGLPWLPEGATLHRRRWPGGVTEVIAFHQGYYVFYLKWKADGEVAMVEVEKKWRGRGIATQAYHWVKENLEPRLHHSLVRTDEGEAWVRKVDPSAPHRKWRPSEDNRSMIPVSAIRRTGSLITTDYPGTEGDASHITRVQTGTVPTSAIAHLRGAKGEVPGAHARRQGQEWEDFKASIAVEGIREPIFVTVDPGQEPVISEGNHRRDAAVELGLAEVPVEVRYYGHAERYHPVAAKQSCLTRQAYFLDSHVTDVADRFISLRQHGYTVDEARFYAAMGMLDDSSMLHGERYSEERCHTLVEQVIKDYGIERPEGYTIQFSGGNLYRDRLTYHYFHMEDRDAFTILHEIAHAIDSSRRSIYSNSQGHDYEFFRLYCEVLRRYARNGNRAADYLEEEYRRIRWAKDYRGLTDDPNQAYPDGRTRPSFTIHDPSRTRHASLSTTASGGTIYRGLRVPITDELLALVRFDYQEMDEVEQWKAKGGKAPLIGQMVLDYMERTGSRNSSGLGIHWTERIQFAAVAAETSKTYPGLPVIIEATYAPGDVVPEGDPMYSSESVWVGNKTEAEVLIRPGSRLRITDVYIMPGMAPGNFLSVENRKRVNVRGDTYYSVLGRPETRTASVSDYGGQHQPTHPDEYGVWLYDLTPMVPEDVYTHPHYYTGFAQWLRPVREALQRTRGNPGAMVTVYRAQPKQYTRIETGNWVTLSLDYARLHLESNVPGGHIVAAKVRADQVGFGGDDLMEWGYFGPTVTGRTASLQTQAEADTEGVMVALVPPAMVNEALVALEQTTEPLDDQHVTVVYLGDTDEVDRDALHKAVSQWAAQARPVQGKVSGFGTFDNPHEKVLYAAWQIEDGPAWRESLKQALRDHGVDREDTYPMWTPHQTLAYTEDVITDLPQMPDGMPREVVFGSIAVVYGSEWTTYPLGNTPE